MVTKAVEQEVYVQYSTAYINKPIRLRAHKLKTNQTKSLSCKDSVMSNGRAVLLNRSASLTPTLWSGLTPTDIRPGHLAMQRLTGLQCPFACNATIFIDPNQ